MSTQFVRTMILKDQCQEEAMELFAEVIIEEPRIIVVRIPHKDGHDLCSVAIELYNGTVRAMLWHEEHAEDDPAYYTLLHDAPKKQQAEQE